MGLWYADLSIRPPDDDVAVEMVKLAARLGYKLIAIEYRENLDFEKIHRVALSEGVRVVKRVTIRGSTRAEVRRALDKLGEFLAGKAIVSVEPESLDAARYAGVNKAVHTIKVKPGMESVVDVSQVRLFENRGWGAFEIPLVYVFKPNGWSYIVEVVRRALRLKAKFARFIAVSDASDIYSMWSPASIIGLLASLGLQPEIAASWVSSSPASIASRV